MASRRVSATETAVEVLEVIEERGSVGVTEVAEATGGSKANVHAHLQTLAEAGLVRSSDGTYRLAHRFLSFATVAKHREPIYREGVANIEKLTNATGATGILVVREGLEAVYLHAVAPQGQQSEQLEGQRMTLTDSPAGLAILSAHAESSRRGVVEQCVESSDRADAVLDRLGSVDNGRPLLSTVDGGDVVEIAAAVVGSDGDPVGAVGLRYPRSRDDEARVESNRKKLVRNTAGTISRRLTMAD